MHCPSWLDICSFWNGDRVSAVYIQPRKRPKTADIDLCSSDSENGGHIDFKSRDPLTSIASNTSNTSNTSNASNTSTTPNASKERHKSSVSTKCKSKGRLKRTFESKRKRGRASPKSIRKCPLCSVSLRDISPIRQQIHINSCTDYTERRKQYTFDVRRECPFCKANLSKMSRKARRQHTTQCMPTADPFNSR